MTPILKTIAKQHVGKEYNAQTNVDAITHSDVDTLVSHFPPCMRSLHSYLRQESHLKHQGRLQYGLFLKGIGLPVEEALLFWRKAFTKKTDEEFQKQYAYNVRYNYGMEGNRKNYAPYSCIKIITQNGPASGDHHGCPFKHYSPDSLGQMLLSFGTPESSVSELLKTARDGHFQIACTRYFELTRGRQGKPGMESHSHHGLGMDVIEHPNQWFDTSVHGGEKVKKESAGKQEEDNGVDSDVQME